MIPGARGRGFLVAVEGIDGAGKTTQVRCLEALLGEVGLPFVSTKEPTSGPWGSKIRQSARSARLPPNEELAAFLEDRREHVREVLEPALDAGNVVLVDRYYLSTVAYQGARGMDPQHLLELNAFAPVPDIVIVLDVPPLVGLNRVRDRGDVADLFEKEDELARARQIFLTLRLPSVRIVDGTRDIESVARIVSGLVFNKIGLSTPSIRPEMLERALGSVNAKASDLAAPVGRPWTS
jgi:dTMP kinase